MRGFPQNIRNGSSFAVVNSEVRFPVFRYLMNRPIQSDFVKNFQIIGFFDVGTAWSGPNPFSKENAFNTETITSGPITVVLDRNLGPVIAGTGFGLRTRLLGYFLRFDWAWGIENGFINEDSVFYFSISTDF
jgi:outer membrane protein assembly factor BamA